jgi:membrane protein required for colicin V production
MHPTSSPPNALSSTVHWVDVAIIAVILACIIVGTTRGLIAAVGSFVGAVVGLLMARYEYTSVESLLAHFFHRDAHLAMAAFVIIFVAVWGLASTLSLVVRTVVRYSPFGLLDRLGGALLGLLVGVLSVAAILQLASSTHDRSLRASIHRSELATVLKRAIPGLPNLIPSRLPGAPRGRSGL